MQINAKNSNIFKNELLYEIYIFFISGKMRSMRLFFSTNDTTSGQLVIATWDSHYKILHFHHGGLDKLAQLLEQWSVIKTKSVKDVCSLAYYYSCRVFIWMLYVYASFKKNEKSAKSDANDFLSDCRVCHHQSITASFLYVIQKFRSLNSILKKACTRWLPEIFVILIKMKTALLKTTILYER